MIFISEKSSYLKQADVNFKNEVERQTKGKYKFLEEYVNLDTPLKVKHLKCGHEYKATPYDFIFGRGRCEKCKK